MDKPKIHDGKFRFYFVYVLIYYAEKIRLVADFLVVFSNQKLPKLRHMRCLIASRFSWYNVGGLFASKPNICLWEGWQHQESIQTRRPLSVWDLIRYGLIARWSYIFVMKWYWLPVVGN